MSSFTELLLELCPNGVGQLRIGDFAMCHSGATPDSKNSHYWSEGTIPWMSSGEVSKGLVYATDNYITQLGFDSCSTKIVPAGSVVMALAGQGKTRGTVARTRIELCTNQSLCSIIPFDSVNADYLYFFLSSKYLELRNLSSGEGGRGGLNLQIIRDVLVPVPPMKVQLEIVKILDAFKMLEAELEAELEARTEQFSHYRKQLLSFDPKEVESKKISTLVSVVRAKSIIPRSQYKSKGEFPIIDQGQGFIAGWTHDESTVLPSGDYVVFGDHTRSLKYIDFPFAQGADGLQILRAVEGVNPRYLYHGMSALDFPNRGYNRHWTLVREMEILIPSLERQSRIASKLDAFDALVNDSAIGLPAELASRRKQYEYYRDQLFTFKEA